MQCYMSVFSLLFVDFPNAKLEGAVIHYRNGKPERLFRLRCTILKFYMQNDRLPFRGWMEILIKGEKGLLATSS